MANDEATDQADSLFWFSEDVIPQYELLVEQGKVSREEAERSRALRAAMGLPMTIAELDAILQKQGSEIHPAVTWLHEVGGPAVSRHEFDSTDSAILGFEIKVAGATWRVDTWKVLRGYSQHAWISRRREVLGGREHTELGPPADGKPGLYWSVTLTGEGLPYVLRNGRAEGLAQALTAIEGVDFTPQTIGGMTLYRGADDEARWVAVYEGDQVEFHSTSEGPWRWTREIGEEKPSLMKMARLFGGYQLRGEAGSLEAAVADSAGALQALDQLAAERLVAGDEQFRAGFAAGRAALKGEIADL